MYLNCYNDYTSLCCISLEQGSAAVLSAINVTILYEVLIIIVLYILSNGFDPATDLYAYRVPRHELCTIYIFWYIGEQWRRRGLSKEGRDKKKHS